MDKWIKIVEMRDLEIMYNNGEISYSRMVEILNELVQRKVDREYVKKDTVREMDTEKQ